MMIVTIHQSDYTNLLTNESTFLLAKCDIVFSTSTSLQIMYNQHNIDRHRPTPRM